MTPHYPEIWRLLQTAGRFEKYASESLDAQHELAGTCSGIYDQFMSKAAEYAPGHSPAGAALQAGRFGAALYATAVSVNGEKVASADVAVTAIEQLATAAFLDVHLKTAADKMSGEEREATQTVRLLGREYAVDLLRSLVG